MKKFVLLILLALSSCKRDQAIPDVKFPDPETQFIKRNQIDTTFIFYRQETQGPEIKTYKTYDRNGHVLFDSTSMVGFERIYYDSRGLPVKIETSTDHSEVSIDLASYKFDNASRILEQTWTSGEERRYRLDYKGRVAEMIRLILSANKKIEQEKIIYKYDNGRLMGSLSFWKGGRTPDVKIDYYYSTNDVLDSSVMKVSTDKLLYRSFYDKDGLLERQYHGDYLDTRRFLHKRRV